MSFFLNHELSHNFVRTKKETMSWFSFGSSGDTTAKVVTDAKVKVETATDAGNGNVITKPVSNEDGSSKLFDGEQKTKIRELIERFIVAGKEHRAARAAFTAARAKDSVDALMTKITGVPEHAAQLLIESKALQKNINDGRDSKSNASNNKTDAASPSAALPAAAAAATANTKTNNTYEPGQVVFVRVNDEATWHQAVFLTEYTATQCVVVLNNYFHKCNVTDIRPSNTTMNPLYENAVTQNAWIQLLKSEIAVHKLQSFVYPLILFCGMHLKVGNHFWYRSKDSVRCEQRKIVCMNSVGCHHVLHSDRVVDAKTNQPLISHVNWAINGNYQLIYVPFVSEVMADRTIDDLLLGETLFLAASDLFFERWVDDDTTLLSEFKFVFM